MNFVSASLTKMCQGVMLVLHLKFHPLLEVWSNYHLVPLQSEARRQASLQLLILKAVLTLMLIMAK